MNVWSEATTLAEQPHGVAIEDFLEKRKRPKLFRVTGRQLNRFPPKSAQLRAYVLTCPVEWLLHATWRHCWASPIIYSEKEAVRLNAPRREEHAATARGTLP